MRHLVLFLILGLGVACSNTPRPEPCGVIPGAGCPLSRGGSCDDLTCDAIYACNDGNWALEAECSMGTGAAGGGGGDGGAGGDICQDVVVDKTGQVSGCTPDLQLPDCGVAAAESCAPCSSGCSDFFLCTSEGWQVRAFCDEDGNVTDE